MNSPSNNLEDNLPMVNYIMLHRIYDVLCLIAKNSSPEASNEIEKMVKYHQDGFLLGPSPAFRAEDGKNEQG
jgi:hypothetical protein